MGRAERKFKPEWKFKPGTIILIPAIKITADWFSEPFVGTVSKYQVYNRNNCKYLCKEHSDGKFKELDKAFVERYAVLADNKAVKVLFRRDV